MARMVRSEPAQQDLERILDYRIIHAARDIPKLFEQTP